jgi:hypothetical protein
VVCKNSFSIKIQKYKISNYFSVRVINASVDEACASCIRRNGICLDENSDDHMDKCFCPTDNDICNDRPPTYLAPVTQPFRKKYLIFRKMKSINGMCML